MSSDGNLISVFMTMFRANQHVESLYISLFPSGKGNSVNLFDGRASNNSACCKMLELSTT